jgi:transcriptional regulator with XRE-family HTH domain
MYNLLLYDSKEGVVKMLSKRIKQLREENSLSQQKLAETLGVTQQAVAKWEGGKAEPDSTMLLKIADMFNVSLDYLLGKTNIKNYEIETIAAHHDGEEWTEEELEEIERFKEFVKMKRQKKETQ